MAKSNKPTDVFKFVDMSGGEDACWNWTLRPGAVSYKMRTGEQSMKSKPRPYFTVAGRKVMATRLVYELVHGVTLVPTQFILHACDNSLCCNPRHMSLGSHVENMAEMVERDRHGLSHATVRNIRAAIAMQKLSHEEIAVLFETSRATVGRIARDEIHTHADDYAAPRVN